MFCSQAFAQAAGASGGGFDPAPFVMLIVLGLIFYFMLFRPQQKRMKQQKEMLEALKRGDRVVTLGGMHGVVTRLDDVEISLEISQGVVVKMNRSAVSEVLSKTSVSPVASGAKVEASEEAATEVKPAAKSTSVKKPARPAAKKKV